MYYFKLIEIKTGESNSKNQLNSFKKILLINKVVEAAQDTCYLNIWVRDI